jgi:tRNA (guanine9-N1)-methyltransferase
MDDDERKNGNDIDSNPIHVATRGTTTTTTTTTTMTESLSLRQQKKMKRMLFNKEQKLKRKEKEKTELKSNRLKRKREINEMLEKMSKEEREAWRKEAFRKKNEKLKDAQKKEKETKEKFAKAKQNVVIDLDFDDVMTPAEKQSMVKQIRICYAVNKKAKISTRLHLTNMNGEGTSRDLREKIDGFENWQGIYTHNNPLLFEIEQRGTKDDEARNKNDYDDEFIFSRRKKDLVYLTADSPFEIDTLSEKDIYIIGGFIDRNRHKLKTLHKAEALGIRHARLPINDFPQMKSSSVLTVNQCFEILVTQLEVNDWKKTIKRSVPLRKTAAAKAKLAEATTSSKIPTKVNEVAIDGDTDYGELSD